MSKIAHTMSCDLENTIRHTKACFILAWLFKSPRLILRVEKHNKHEVDIIPNKFIFQLFHPLYKARMESSRHGGKWAGQTDRWTSTRETQSGPEEETKQGVRGSVWGRSKSNLYADPQWSSDHQESLNHRDCGAAAETTYRRSTPEPWQWLRWPLCRPEPQPSPPRPMCRPDPTGPFPGWPWQPKNRNQ